MKVDTKQAALVVATFCAFLFLGYQIYQLVDNDVASTPSVTHIAPAPQAYIPAKQKIIATQSAVRSIPQPQVAYYAPAHVAPVSTQPSPELMSEQKAYLQLVNQYELARMQRLLLEEQASIALAQQRIAKLNQETRQISTDTKATTDIANQATKDNDSTNASAAQDENAQYRLGYLDEQGGKWSATLVEGSQYQEVNEGDTLPSGYQVIKIYHEGVILALGDDRELVSFNGVVNMKAKAASAFSHKNEDNNVDDVDADFSPVKSQSVNTDASTFKPTHYSSDASRVGFAEDALNHVPVEAASATQSQYTDAEQAILSRKPNHYTLRLMSTDKASAITQFITKNHLQTKTLQYRTTNADGDLYGLLYGDYASVTSAQLALMNLPDIIKVGGPVIRQFREVQGALKKRA